MAPFDTNFRNLCLLGNSAVVTPGKCLVIGEVAQSHDGSLGMAHSFIDAIERAGADAVKFQTHIASEESTPMEPWRVKFSTQDESRYAYWQRMEFSKQQWGELKRHADDCGLLFLSTPFSPKAVALLDEIGMKVWKIASGEIGNDLLLKQIAKLGHPIILSSGMSDWEELDRAVELVNSHGNPLAILQCTTEYPCPPERVGLNMLAAFRERYSVPVGLSDHSGSIYAGCAAAALGAEVLEVHVALSKEMFGPDVPASVTTGELRQLVEGVRQIERMVDAPISKNEIAEEMRPLRELFTKSLVANGNLPAGTILREEHISLKKPGVGLQASALPQLLGRRLSRDLVADDILQFSDLEVETCISD